MPYIPPVVRRRIDLKMHDLLTDVDMLSPGELNYTLTRIVNAWADEWRVIEGGTDRYHHLLEAHGTFGAAAAEFYRRRVAPYEDEMCERNGDVY